MQRGTLILTGLLAAQLGLAGLLAVSGSDYAAFDAKDPVIAFDQGKIDQIAIDQTGGGSVTLKKEEGKWVIPAFVGFPADATKVTQFLDKLHELKKGFPVATSSDAAARFKVSDLVNERRIVLSSGGKEVGKLLVGTSPSYRLANVRPATGNDIYSVTFSAFEAGVNSADWMDREALSIPGDQVAAVTVSGVTLERKDGKFTPAGLGEGEKAVDSKVQDAGRIAMRPTFDMIQGKGPDALAKLDPPDFTVDVKKTDGTTRTYKFKKEAAGGAYLFAASDRDYVFRVAEASVAGLAGAKRETLVDGPGKASAAQPTETPNKADAAAPAETPNKADAAPAEAPNKGGAAQADQIPHEKPADGG
jgi:hypothetical protein